MMAAFSSSALSIQFDRFLGFGGRGPRRRHLPARRGLSVRRPLTRSAEARGAASRRANGRLHWGRVGTGFGQAESDGKPKEP